MLEGLNPAQREAVESAQGPVLIVAGPGSGKTRVITHRVAYLVRVCGVSPRRILAVTFTNKAANEMKSRLQRLVPGQADDLTMGTFHSFCTGMLHRDGKAVGLDTFTIYDDDDQLGVLKRAMEEADIDPRSFPRRAVQSAISKAKSLLLDAREYSMSADSYFEQVVGRIYERYQGLMESNRAVDFDDLLLRAVQLLKGFPDVLKRYQRRFVHILIDEFQDTNVAQYELAKLLAAGYKNICVVGDPDQSIYSWRNADLRNILSFQRDYPDAKVVNLEENYRSTQNILNAAKHLIASNRMRLDKDLRTNKEQGRPIAVHEAFTEEEEGLFVVQEVDRLMREEELKLRDCAVMYRTNAQSRAFEEACLRYGVKYKLVGGIRFYQRREVKDVIAYLRLLSNPSDEISLLRVLNVPPRGIGQRSLQELVRWCASQRLSLPEGLRRVAKGQDDGGSQPPLMPRVTKAVEGFMALLEDMTEASGKVDVVVLVDKLLERVRYRQYLQQAFDDPDERWDNVMELRATARGFGEQPPPEGLTLLLERLALVSDIDNWDEQTDALTLITLHQAKGLEFPVVFITGMEEGLLPHSRSMDTTEELEEERRLCYVGITRAQERLYLLRSFRRGMMGSSGPTLPSRFLREVPAELVSYVSPERERKVNLGMWGSTVEKEPAPVNPGLKAGDKVRHTIFGEGIVVSCVPSGEDHEVTVAFKGSAGVKRLLYSFARLEKRE